MSRPSFSFPESLRGQLNDRKVNVALVVSRFHEEITKKLARGALDACKQAGLPEESIDIHYIPGALELPQAVAKIAKAGKCQAIIALGAIIQGETTHADIIAKAIFPALTQLSITYPIAFATGILTTATMDQANARAGGVMGNIGFEAACTALEMLHWQGERF